MRGFGVCFGLGPALTVLVGLPLRLLGDATKLADPLLGLFELSAQPAGFVYGLLSPALLAGAGLDGV